MTSKLPSNIDLATAPFPKLPYPAIPLFKVEQIAYHVPNISEAIASYNLTLGLTKWVTDEVTANGTVFGKPVTNQHATLAFNYEMGYEFELLHYHEDSPNWHRERVKQTIGMDPGPISIPFHSHIAFHVTESDMQFLKKHYTENLGLELIQEVHTTSHTNPYLLERKRTYHYCIFDTSKLLGTDLKLIERIEHS